MPTIDVAAGVLTDAAGRVLIAQRPVGSVLAGWWEFPGGKIAGGETAREALERELAEELGIRILAAEPLITFSHSYPERVVTLHVFRVNRYSGEPTGAEGQPVRCGNS